MGAVSGLGAEEVRSDPDQAPAGDAEAEELLALLTPIAKAFITETGYEALTDVYGDF